MQSLSLQFQNEAQIYTKLIYTSHKISGNDF